VRSAISNDNLFFMIAGAQIDLDDCLYCNEDQGPLDYCLFKRVIILTRVRIVRYRQSSVAMDSLYFTYQETSFKRKKTVLFDGQKF